MAQWLTNPTRNHEVTSESRNSALNCHVAPSQSESKPKSSSWPTGRTDSASATSLTLTPPLPLAHSTPAAWAPSSVLTQTRYIPTTGPLHWLFLTFRVLIPALPTAPSLSSSRSLLRCHFSASESLTTPVNTAAALTARALPSTSLLPFSFHTYRHLRKCIFFFIHLLHRRAASWGQGLLSVLFTYRAPTVCTGPC